MFIRFLYIYFLCFFLVDAASCFLLGSVVGPVVGLGRKVEMGAWLSGRWGGCFVEQIRCGGCMDWGVVVG